MGELSSTVRVVVIDDDPLVRSALDLMLGGQPDIEVVGEACDGAEGLQLVERTRPDVVLMDVRMPVMSGLAATRALRASEDPPAILVLTTFDADEYVVEAVAAGANGFLLKSTHPPRSSPPYATSRPATPSCPPPRPEASSTGCAPTPPSSAPRVPPRSSSSSPPASWRSRCWSAEG